MAYMSISLADLMTIPGFAHAYGNNDEDVLKAIYHGCGLDITKEFDWHHCTHRRISGEIVTCDRIEGHERFDREWLDSGYASYDTRIDSYGDVDFRIELKKMRHIGCVDAAFRQDFY